MAAGDHKVPTVLDISELFYSIQGESSHAGYPCVFVRLAGCNLRCGYCDARYSYEEPAQSLHLPEVLTAIGKLPRVERVEITGGEPLVQEGVYPLIEALLDEGRRVLLETNGSISLDRLPAEVHCIMDIKCPGSGMSEHFLVRNLKLLDRGDEIKFVISHREDYNWARQLIATHGLGKQGPALIFSPVTSALNPAELAAWLLADALPARLQLQLHTLLWPRIARGA